MTKAPMIDETHDPEARSWLSDANGHADFPVQNLPLGIFSPDGAPPCGGVAIGNHIIDLPCVAPLLDGEARQAAEAASGPTLNPLLALGAGPRRSLRRALFALLTDPAMESRVRPALHPAADCALHLPAQIGDYTDFYSGIHHAENVGRLFRPDNPLLPNYKYIPIGYHGRASSICVSGAPLKRPSGQTMPPGAAAPLFGPAKRLDYELELGIWIGEGNALGSPVPITGADHHIAGLCLLNDWSARDIQAWEYQPLGPFLAKNFLTTISHWIVTAEALAPYRTAQPARNPEDPAPLPYLYDETDQASGAYAITIETHILTAAMRKADLAPYRLSHGNVTSMYWTAAQLVAHHTSNGCNLHPGDLLGTGTLSGAAETSLGSLLEISRGGTQPVMLPTGETRTFLEDGDALFLTAFAEAPGRVRIGFGPCAGKVIPA